mmetsp:Transcript_8905/g.16054  ORF Transcript_8905/g.16054 Transcript_8905/m.16054 type:complete len:540 (-) Transcript_8905:1173-2792(-)
MKLQIKSSTGIKFEVAVDPNEDSVSTLKGKIATESGIESQAQRLIYRGHVLKDNQTIQELVSKNGLEDGHTMHLVRSAASKAQPTSTASAPSSMPANPLPGSTPAPTSGAGAPPTNSPFGSNLFGAGAPPMTGTGFPPMGGMGGMDLGSMQQQMMQNPEMMQQMMNSPMMQSMLQNPELVRSMMMANPQIRGLMESNPELAHVLNDPNNLRQAIEMARNPTMMNEMMRNTDRAMANIEMMPGGFDALRRMHENVQAPLQDAMLDNNTNNNADSENPFASLFNPATTAPSTAPMPNPWNPTPAQPATNNAAAGAAPDFSSLFGAGAGGMPGVPGGGTTPDPNQVIQMLENPMMQQMMQSMLADPAMREQAFSANPILRQAVDQNPEMAQMLQNPEFLRMMMNPEVLRASLTLQNAMRGMQGGSTGGVPGGFGYPPTGTPTQDTTRNTAATGTAPPETNPGLDALMNMFANSGAVNNGATARPAPAAAPLSQEQLEQMYASQLQQLRDMGFIDTSMCIRALQTSGGNVNLAVERLLNQFGS